MTTEAPTWAQATKAEWDEFVADAEANQAIVAALRELVADRSDTGLISVARVKEVLG